MFGYVRAREDTLPEGARERYQTVYCGLCHTMGEYFGITAPFFLNYDFAFLAMALAPNAEYTPPPQKRCALHPLKGRLACEGEEWLTLAAAESVILTHWKLTDSISDGGLRERVEARGLLALTDGGYQKACALCPGFNEVTRDSLQELSTLEKEGCTSLDQTADRFASLLRAAVPKSGNAARDRVLEQLLYHLGRWIYLVDAVDDLAEDRAAGRYNPVAARFPLWSEEDRNYLRQIMDHSLSLVGAAFQLLERNPWTAVMENIIYSGLPSVEELVFSEKWREYQKTYRRHDP